MAKAIVDAWLDAKYIGSLAVTERRVNMMKRKQQSIINKKYMVTEEEDESFIGNKIKGYRESL